MDRNKITREGFRRILLEATDSLPVTFPASPCPYPAGAIGPASDNISYTGDSTPKGGVSVTGARLQRVLNRAAYEDNVRWGVAGSAMNRVLQGGARDEQEGEDKYFVPTEGRGGGPSGYFFLHQNILCVTRQRVFSLKIPGHFCFRFRSLAAALCFRVFAVRTQFGG